VRVVLLVVMQQGRTRALLVKTLTRCAAKLILKCAMGIPAGYLAF
jgi:hypothetical protein